MGKEEEIFLPGTVVFQYINDDERCVGVVSGDHMVDFLSKKDQEFFQIHHEKGVKKKVLKELARACPQ